MDPCKHLPGSGALGSLLSKLVGLPLIHAAIYLVSIDFPLIWTCQYQPNLLQGSGCLAVFAPWSAAKLISLSASPDPHAFGWPETVIQSESTVA